LGRGEGSTLTESSKQAGGFGVDEQTITKRERAERKKAVERRDLAFVALQLGVAIMLDITLWCD
jgi:hypothetical protein